MPATVLLGVLAGVTSVLEAAPYIRDVLRRTTRPHRGTWLIWSVLSILALEAQYAEGATWSVVMVAAEAAATSTIFLLSVQRGEGGLSRSDLAILGIAAGGVAAWAISSTPVVAIGCVLVADTLAIGLMVPKTWRDPFSETLALYVLASASGAMSALAVGSFAVPLLLFPVFFAAANVFLAVLIAGRRAQLAPAPSPSGLGAPSSPERHRA